MNTTTALFLRSDPAMLTSPRRRYARVGVRDPRPYVHICGRILFLAPWLLYVHVHATCAPLLRHVRPSTTTRARLYIDQYVHTRRDQNDNATYASTRCIPTITHVLACEDVAGESQQSGGPIVFFARTHFLACEGVAGGSQQSGGNVFSSNTVAHPVGPRCQVEE